MKRKKYLNRTLQYRYLFIILFSMVALTLFVGGCLYYFMFSLLAEQIILPDYMVRDLMPLVRHINITLATGLPVFFLMILGWSFFLSYRFLAPLERLEEGLQKIDSGDYSVRLQVRKDHDLSPIAEVINDLVDKLGKKTKKKGDK